MKKLKIIAVLLFTSVNNSVMPMRQICRGIEMTLFPVAFGVSKLYNACRSVSSDINDRPMNIIENKLYNQENGVYQYNSDIYSKRALADAEKLLFHNGYRYEFGAQYRERYDRNCYKRGPQIVNVVFNTCLGLSGFNKEIAQGLFAKFIKSFRDKVIDRDAFMVRGLSDSKIERHKELAHAFETGAYDLSTRWAPSTIKEILSISPRSVEVFSSGILFNKYLPHWRKSWRNFRVPADWDTCHIVIKAFMKTSPKKALLDFSEKFKEENVSHQYLQQFVIPKLFKIDPMATTKMVLNCITKNNCKDINGETYTELLRNDQDGSVKEKLVKFIKL